AAHRRLFPRGTSGRKRGRTHGTGRPRRDHSPGTRSAGVVEPCRHLTRTEARGSCTAPPAVDGDSGGELSRERHGAHVLILAHAAPPVARPVEELAVVRCHPEFPLAPTAGQRLRPRL